MNQEILQIWTVRAQGGDRRAADRLARHLLTKFKPAIANAARSLGDQESFSAAGLAISEAIRTVRPGDSIEAFFFCRFYSLCLTQKRSDARRFKNQADAAEILFERTGDVETEFAIQAKLKNAALSNREREIVLARLRGETFKEISKSLRVSTAAVGQALSRIFKKLESVNELA